LRRRGRVLHRDHPPHPSRDRRCQDSGRPTPSAEPVSPTVSSTSPKRPQKRRNPRGIGGFWSTATGIRTRVTAVREDLTVVSHCIELRFYRTFSRMTQPETTPAGILGRPQIATRVSGSSVQRIGDDRLDIPSRSAARAFSAGQRPRAGTSTRGRGVLRPGG
jgi:hypothetical protein